MYCCIADEHISIFIRDSLKLKQLDVVSNRPLLNQCSTLDENSTTLSYYRHCTDSEHVVSFTASQLKGLEHLHVYRKMFKSCWLNSLLLTREMVINIYFTMWENLGEKCIARLAYKTKWWSFKGRIVSMSWHSMKWQQQ